MENWNHLSANGMATNTDPVYGGIIDSEIVSGLWFVIPNHPGLKVMGDFASKADAFAALESALHEAALSSLDFLA